MTDDQDAKKQLKTFETTTSAATFGLPGSNVHIRAVFKYTDPDDPRNNPGLPGKYKVLFTLNKSGLRISRDSHWGLAELSNGDSHLKVITPESRATELSAASPIQLIGNVNGQLFEFKGHANNKGYLAQIELESIDAENFDDAEQRAYRALSSMLSFCSLYFDISLYIYQVDVIELRTRSWQINIKTPYLDIPFGGAERIETGSEEFRTFASIYREGLNSNSPFFQFLCFFKIIEALGAIWTRRERAAKKKGDVFTRPSKRIPETYDQQLSWLNELFPLRHVWADMKFEYIFLEEALGIEIDTLIKTKLKVIRNAIGHALLDPGSLTLYTDDDLHVNEIHRWLPLTKCITRYFLKTEFPSVFGKV